MMVEPLVKELLEAGVHFGHQTHRWNPKMKRFIFGEKNGIYLVDLEQTARGLEAAQGFLRKVAAEGGTVLFVGTKRQAQPIIAEQATRCGQFYVNVRWLGGLLTNFQTIRKSVTRLKAIRTMREDGTFQRLTKKEVARLEKELGRLEKMLGGIIEMPRLPRAVYVVDAKREETAVREAKRLGIPVVALVDTNSDPDPIDYPIPGNDDAIRSVKLVTSLLAEAALEGRQAYLAGLAEQEAEEARKRPQEEAVSAAQQSAEAEEGTAVPEQQEAPPEEEPEAIIPEGIVKSKVKEAVPPPPKRRPKGKELREEEKPKSTDG